MRRRRWDGVPTQVRVVVGTAVGVLSYGTVVHVYQLAGSAADPYPGLPGWLAGYFVALTALDPLAAGLLALRRRAGLVLACAVLVTDALGNAAAVYRFDPHPGLVAGRLGQAVITVLAVGLVVTAPRIRPWLLPSPA